MLMLLLLCWVRPLPAQAADALVQGSLAGSSAGQQRKAKADNKGRECGLQNMNLPSR
jgi:hypothetical protein